MPCGGVLRAGGALVLAGGLLGFGLGLRDAAADAVASGEATYREQCAMCHGPGARGDGPAAAMLNPKPRDLSAADFWAGRTDEAVAAVVRQGRPGTAMMGYESVLSPEQIRNVVRYLRAHAQQ